MKLSGISRGVNALLGIKGVGKEKKPSIVKSLVNRPEDFMLVAYFEDEEIVVRIKKKPVPNIDIKVPEEGGEESLTSRRCFSDGIHP